MKSIMNLRSGSDLNKLLIPGGYSLYQTGSYVNMPSDANGKAGFMRVEYTTNDASTILQTLNYRDGVGKPTVMMRYIFSDSANPYPSGVFIYNGWYKITTELT